MLDGRGATVGGWRASDSPNDLQEAFVNTKRASGRPPAKGKGSKAAAAAGTRSASRGSGDGSGPAAGDTRDRKATGSAPSSASRRSGAAAKSASGSKKKAAPTAAAAAGKKKSAGGAKRAATGSVASIKRGGSVSSSKGARSQGKRSAANSKRSAASSRGRGSTSKKRKSSSVRRSLVSSSGGGSKRKQLSLAVAAAQVMEEEEERRSAVVAEEEMERGGYHPIYNVLVMEMVRSQMQQLNARQQLLNSTFDSLRAEGFPIGEGDEAAMEKMLDKLRQKLQSDAQDEAHRLREENTSLRERLEDRSLEVEKKMAELEVLRNTMARKLARTEVDNEHLRAEAQSVLQDATLDVERMKKELGHRIDIATASLRTPKYGSSLRSLQDLTTDVQNEIQDHRDRLSKLIASIGARDTFKRDPSNTMHSNFPTQYRAQLRRLERDNLINILDVLSFQEGVVDTVGKALYVLSETEHKTAVV